MEEIDGHPWKSTMNLDENDDFEGNPIDFHWYVRLLEANPHANVVLSKSIEF